jgi:drug/metabolite transporter (DMT)-like permease
LINRQGIAALCLAMAFFLTNDTLVKLASVQIGIFQSLFLRGALASIVLTWLAWRMGAFRLSPGWRHPTVLWRAGIDALASMVYMAGLVQLPLANATAINLATPLFITVLAVLVLRERVDALRWGLIISGFVGVLLVVQPQVDGFSGYAWLCVLGTMLHAVRDLITRRIPAGIPSALVTQTNAVAAMALGGVMCLGQPWQPVAGRPALYLALAAVCLCMAYSLMVRATRQSELSVVAPFRYTGLLYALLGGYWVWGEVPNAWAWSGIALLVTSGLVMLQRERLRAAP